LPQAWDQRADPRIRGGRLFYRWKAKYGGMAPPDAAKLKTLEDENRRLKKLLAEAMLDVAALKDVLGKN
jgi:putative transposase